MAQSDSSQFDNVAVIKAANIYFDGKVTSRTVLFADGSRKTLGILMPGDYRFGTEAAEIMEILAGSLTFSLDGENWQRVSGGEQFEVPANSHFQMQVDTVTDYCCSYLEN